MHPQSLAAPFGATARRLLSRFAEAARSGLSNRYARYNANAFSHLFEHEQMLADEVRMASYARGIREHIGPNDRVLDVGTGTGVLAMLAARATQGEVVAIDHSDFIEAAAHAAAANGLDNIRFDQVHSARLSCDQGFDVLLHEQLGNCLFDEDMLTNLLDLKRRLLRPGGRILPARFALHVEPVLLREDYAVPRIWAHKDLHGLDFSAFETAPDLSRFAARNHRSLHLPQNAFERTVCTPEPLLEVDLNNIDQPEQVPVTSTLVRTAELSGTVSALVVYFELRFDERNRFDTSPFSRRTHWGNRVFRVDPVPVAHGQPLKVRLAVPSWTSPRTWQVALSNEAVAG